MAYSHSRIGTFENCPLSYKFRYLDRIHSDKQGIEAFMGSVVHRTLEKLYRDLKLSAVPSTDELLELYDNEWEKSWNDDVFIVRSDYSADDYRKTGRRCIRDYYKRYYPFDQGRTLWIEQSVRIPLDPEASYPFTGVVDRLVETEDGCYEIHDYKSGGSCPDQGKIDSDRQLALYQLAVETAFPDAESVRLVWHYLVFDKTFESIRTKEQIEELKSRTLALITEIESTEEFEARESALCEWCSYQELCPKRKHPASVEKMTPTEFSEDEGVRLADRYVELKDQESEIKSLTEQAKSDVIGYCVQHSVENVRGANRMVSVTFAPSASFSKAGTAERKKLEEVLEEMGILDEFLSLDSRALAKAYLEGRWGESCAKLDPFAVIDNDACRVTTKKLREEE